MLGGVRLPKVKGPTPDTIGSYISSGFIKKKERKMTAKELVGELDKREYGDNFGDVVQDGQLLGI